MAAPDALRDLLEEPSSALAEAIVLPVIHLEGEAEIRADLEVAAACNVPGVFLIDHTAREPSFLTAVVASVRQRYPELWVGANYLGESLLTMLQAMRAGGDFDERSLPDGLWGDEPIAWPATAAAYGRAVRQAADELYLDYQKPRIFGAVAFKYQRPQPANATELAQAVRLANEVCDVLVTSGPATGVAPDTEKIAALAANASRPVAIASGTTPRNAHALLAAGARILMVNTGVSTKGRLDVSLLSELMQVVSEWRR